jgi:DNA invertase Pin-like site-specific DNA recombinase
MPGVIVGYARTSTVDQQAGLDAQVRDLKAGGAEKVFAEQVSSMAERPQLKACLAYLRDGDALIVTKPDRLARSTAELLTIHRDLEQRGIGLVVQSMGLDTRTNGANPTTRLILTVLAGVAQWEREMMLERQREGIAKAKAEKKYKGRAPTVRRQADEIRAAIAAGEKPAHVAKRLGVARSSVYRMLEEQPAERDGEGAQLPSPVRLRMRVVEDRPPPRVLSLGVERTELPVQPPVDAAQSPKPSPSSGASQAARSPRVSEAERAAYIRSVRTYVGSGDDPDGSGDAWCKAHAEEIVKIAAWAAEELKSYRVAEKTLDRARSEASVPRGRPRAEYFQSHVRMEAHLRMLALRRRNASGQTTQSI